MGTGFPGQAAFRYLRTVLSAHTFRLTEARRAKDRGASAIELAIITAVVVGLAIAVLVVVTQVVQQRQAQITNQNGKIP